MKCNWERFVIENRKKTILSMKEFWSISSFYNLIIIDWQILNKLEKLIYQSWVRNPLDKFQCKMQGLCPTVTSTENWIGQNVPISLAMYLGS